MYFMETFFVSKQVNPLFQRNISGIVQSFISEEQSAVELEQGKIFSGFHVENDQQTCSAH